MFTFNLWAPGCTREQERQIQSQVPPFVSVSIKSPDFTDLVKLRNRIFRAQAIVVGPCLNGQTEAFLREVYGTSFRLDLLNAAGKIKIPKESSRQKTVFLITDEHVAPVYQEFIDLIRVRNVGELFKKLPIWSTIQTL